jgi:hypothetical protein
VGNERASISALAYSLHSSSIEEINSLLDQCAASCTLNLASFCSTCTSCLHLHFSALKFSPTLHKRQSFRSESNNSPSYIPTGIPSLRSCSVILSGKAATISFVVRRFHTRSCKVGFFPLLEIGLHLLRFSGSLVCSYVTRRSSSFRCRPVSRLKT